MIERGTVESEVRRKPYRLGVAIPLALSTWLVASAVCAQPKGVDEKERAARVECAAGNYQAGVRILAELWVETEDTTWLYNQGRCYEQNGQNQEAANSFREYLRVDKTLKPDEVQEMEARIATLQSSKSPGSLVAKPSTRSDVTLTDSSSSPHPARPIYKKWWFWTGVGAAVVAGTVTAFFLANQSGAAPCDGASRICVEVP